MKEYPQKMNMLEKIKNILRKLGEAYNKINIEQFKIAYGIIFGASFLIITFMFALLISDIITQPDVEATEAYKPTIPTKIYDIKGEVISEFFSEQRELVEYKDLPKNLIYAIVAMEDNNFFRHDGIDIFGIFRGTIGNLLMGKRMRGASTLTQQIARGIVLKSSERTIMRKLKEIWVTFQIEKRYTKEEIVTFYFNQIFFGHSVYGVQAASRFYFNKNVQDLDLAECAMLATLPPSPNAYSPINNPNTSTARHKVVLGRMVDLRFITKNEANRAYKEFWETFKGKIGRRGTTAYSASIDRAPYVTEYVRRILVERYGEKHLKEEGLKIYTTIDLKKQEVAQEVLSEALIEQNRFYAGYAQNIDGIYDRSIIDRVDMISLMFGIPYDIGKNKLQALVRSEMNQTVSLPLALFSDVFGLKEINMSIIETMKASEAELSRQVEGALISIDPRNGYIVSMVGGSGFTPRNQFNRAIQARRQAGSAFKPFVYAYALESTNFTLASIINDAPIGYMIEGEKYWVPQNYDGTYKGRVSFKQALTSSINIATVNILDKVGVSNAIEYIKPIFHAENDKNKAARMFNNDLTLGLGTGLFTPLELTEGFAVFANQGKEVNPILIRYVTDRYNIVIDNFEEDQKKRIAIRGGEKQVVSRETAYLISDILTGVLRGGTATSAMARAGFKRLASGKTGTSSDWKDAWFVGYTPQLVTGIWLGFDSFDYSLGRDRAGGRISAPIWGKYMKSALEDIPSEWFRRPSNIVEAKVCAISGLAISPACYEFKDELFISGTVPTDTCDICAEDLRDLEDLNNILDSFVE